MRSSILNVPTEYKEGCRVLLLMHRNKEGVKKEKHDRDAIKRVTNSPEEFDKCLNELVEIATKSEIPYRIYSTVNARDVDKAIRRFKFVQLEADFYDKKSRQDFYIDVKNRWISSLMQPQSRAENNFLIDVDNKEEDHINAVYSTLKQVYNAELLDVIETKNGCHFITKQFNANMWPKHLGEIKKDSLMLIYYK